MAKNSPGQRPHRLHRTILLVEDDVFLMETIKEVIEEEFPYCQVHSATTGYQALKTTEHITPDLIVSNYHLPDTDGVKVYEDIRKKNGKKQIPLLLLSAEESVGDIFHTQYPTQENMCFVGKPFHLDTVLHTIETLISYCH